MNSILNPASSKYSFITACEIFNSLPPQAQPGVDDASPLGLWVHRIRARTVL